MPDRNDIRARILTEATRLFARRGFRGTSLQAVAEAVGVRKPSLLYHFGSKHELGQQVMALLLSHWKSEIPSLLAAASSGQDRFSAVIMALLDFFQEDPNRARLVLRALLDDPAASRAGIAEHLRPWTTVLTDYVRMGQRAGIVKANIDPESYLIHVIVMVIGTVAVGDVAGAMFDATEGGGAPPAARIAELVRIARDALFVDAHSEAREAREAREEANLRR